MVSVTSSDLLNLQAYHCYLEIVDDEDVQNATKAKAKQNLSLLLSFPASADVTPVRAFHVYLKETYGGNLDKYCKRAQYRC
jgi:hypothetical protein